MKYARYTVGLNDFKYCASLSIRHPSIDPTAISEALGIEPYKTSLVGKRRCCNSERVYDFSLWQCEWSVEEGESIPELLERVVNRLTPHQQFLRRITKEGGRTECFIGIFVERICDQIYTHELLKQLTELHIDLRLDQYASTDND